MKYKIATVVFTVVFTVSLILNIVFYFQIRHLEEINRNNESQIQDLSQTISRMVYSLYYQDIQTAVQRWIEVHGSPPEGVEVKQCYINTGDVAAWIDPTGNLEFQFKAGDYPSIYGPRFPWGSYWEGFPYPDWVRPPEVIAVWVQLYNKSSGLWSLGAEVLSRKIGDFACYFINSSTHKVIGIDGYYAVNLSEDFRDNNLSKTFPTPNYYVGFGSYGMRDDGSWKFDLLVYVKDNGLSLAYDGLLKIDWKTETASIETLKPK